MSKRQKLLIIGYGRHGKDTLAEMLAEHGGYKFTSSSVFVGEEAVWPNWGCAVYPSFDEMFEDRVNHRQLWMEMISAYNMPDKTRTARTMFSRGYDMYVGMRRYDELMACKAAGLFDAVIWVDRSRHLPEETGSMDITRCNANPDHVVDNNGTLERLRAMQLPILLRKLGG